MMLTKRLLLCSLLLVAQLAFGRDATAELPDAETADRLQPSTTETDQAQPESATFADTIETILRKDVPKKAALRLAPSPDAMRRAESLFIEVIPHLELKEATFEEAFGVIRRLWEEKHPGEMLPVGVTDFVANDNEDAKDYTAKITLDLKKIPFFEAFRYLAVLSNKEFLYHNGLLELRNVTQADEDWAPRVYEVTPAVLAALRLKPDSAEAEIRRALAKLGVELNPWMKLGVFEGRFLFVTGHRREQEQIAGVLFLLSKGYKITK